jgi:hypothetical protein
MIHSYPSIYAIGHRALKELLDDPVVVQEKVDGSQISFGLYPVGQAESDGAVELQVRSKGAMLNLAAPEKMFLKGIEAIRRVAHLLVPRWTYRGEYLAKPQHNALAYSRIPHNYIVLFDINDGLESYMEPDRVRERADQLEFESVPLMHHGYITTAESFREMLERDSFLGGQKIEGVVVKNYAKFGPDKKVLMGKFVSEKFKEVHARVWAYDNPKQGDIVERIAAKYRTGARWDKSLIHLREAGKIEDSPRDIGLLIKEVWPDILKECEQDIKDELFAWAEDSLRRKVNVGLADWYKNRLLERQFCEGLPDPPPGWRA